MLYRSYLESTNFKLQHSFSAGNKILEKLKSRKKDVLPSKNSIFHNHFVRKSIQKVSSIDDEDYERPARPMRKRRRDKKFKRTTKAVIHARRACPNKRRNFLKNKFSKNLGFLASLKTPKIEVEDHDTGIDDTTAKETYSPPTTTTIGKSMRIVHIIRSNYFKVKLGVFSVRIHHQGELRMNLWKTRRIKLKRKGIQNSFPTSAIFFGRKKERKETFQKLR